MRTASQLSLTSLLEMDAASSTPDNRSFRQNWTPATFSRFGSSGVGAKRKTVIASQSPNSSTISEKLTFSVKSGMRKAGSLSSIMDKFKKGGESSKRMTRPSLSQVEFTLKTDESIFIGDDATAETSATDQSILLENGNPDPDHQQRRKASPSLLSITEMKESSNLASSDDQSLRKPRRKLFSGKMPSLKKISLKKSKKGEKERASIFYDTNQEDIVEKEMIESQDNASSIFEYADETSSNMTMSAEMIHRYLLFTISLPNTC